MVADRRSRLLDELVRLAQRWARGRGYDPERLAMVRGALLSDTHARLVADVPLYADLAARTGTTRLPRGVPAEIPDLLADRQLLTDGVFKSYDPRWLDIGDYSSMTRWLGTIARLPASPEAAAEATDLDEWLSALVGTGLRPVVSSGTSGALSVVPRDEITWRAVRRINTAVLAPLVLGADTGPGTRVERMAGRAAAATLPAYTFATVADRVRPRRSTAFLLDFASGSSGNQSLGREIAGAFEECHALYPAWLPAEALRALVRGPRSAAAVGALRTLRAGLAAVEGAAAAGGTAASALGAALDGTGGEPDRDPYLRRLVGNLRATAGTGRRVFLFGTPYQLLRLVRAIATTGRPVHAPPGSVVLCGGGWKTFAGDSVPRDVLVSLVQTQLGVPDLVEAYSMIELNTALLRCPAGRFHVPPLIAPYVVDEALRPLPTNGRPVRGRFAFLDPLARTYPGFLVSGDEVTLHPDGCDCGLSGPAVTDIGRASRQEVKGCAGIAASLPV